MYVYIYIYMYMYICSHPFIQFYTCTSRIFDCHLWLPSSYSHFFVVQVLLWSRHAGPAQPKLDQCQVLPLDVPPGSSNLMGSRWIKMDQFWWLGVQHAPTILANLETAWMNCWTFSTPNFAWADDRRWLQCMFSDVAESFWTYWPTANSAAVDIYGDQGWFSQATNERTMVWIGS